MHLAFVWLYFFGMGIPFAIFFPLVLGSRLFFQKSQFYFPVSLAFFYHISTRESTARYETRKQKYIRLS